MRLGIIGYGFVGKAIYNFFKDKIECNIYDKYNELYNNIINIKNTNYCYVIVPTPYDIEINGYDYRAIYDVFDNLLKINYEGIIILKSTVAPEFTNSLIEKYNTLNIVYNPEFLSVKTADFDFANQFHIIIGSNNELYQKKMYEFYYSFFPNATISLCSVTEAEMTKIFCNSFYACKIQIFNEFYFICNKTNVNFNNVKDLMIKNSWINPHHTQVPGPDGLFGFGGLCLIKDIQSLNSYIKSKDCPNKMLEAAIIENNKIRGTGEFM